MNPLFVISIIVSLCAPAKHVCRWELCPYQGVTIEHTSESVANYTGHVCTEAYHIDILHIQYPTLDADQLDLLLTIKR